MLRIDADGQPEMPLWEPWAMFSTALIPEGVRFVGGNGRWAFFERPRQPGEEGGFSFYYEIWDFYFSPRFLLQV